MTFPPLGEDLMRGPYGRELINFIQPCVAPLHWMDESSSVLPRNGSAFFVRTSSALFGITAGHVYDAFKEQMEENSRVVCRLYNLKVDLRDRLISRSSHCDLATFEILPSELGQLDRRATPWPPAIPLVNKSVLIAGFPGVGKRRSESAGLTFGLVKALTTVDSVGDQDLSMLRPPDGEVTDVDGKGLLPRNFDFSGMSGGPVVTVLERLGIDSFALAGVIYECSTDFEIIKAVRADLIGEDGTVPSGAA